MKINKTKLKNGLSIITVPMPDNPSVTVLVMVEAGSKYESKEINGLSHFLEHMVFKGTHKRPRASDISKELDSIGAHYNAFTTQEFTGYYAKAASKHLDVILDIVSDMYVNPLFDISEIDKEKGVIVEEIRMYNDLPQRHVFDILSGLMHGDQPAGWSVLGSEGTVKSMARDQLIQYRDKHYVASATTIVVAGSFNQQDILAKIEKTFDSIMTSPKVGKLAVIEDQTSPQVKVEYKETDQTHLAIAVRTFAVTDKRIPAMLVLSTVLGGGMSSRLFSRMRDDLGICYYIRASHNPATDHGDLTISAGVDNSRVQEAIKEIVSQCRKMITEPVPSGELQKAKDYIAGTTLLELETSDARAEYCGVQEIMKRNIDLPQDIIKKVNAVTVEDVQKLAGQIFIDQGLNMAIIGRFKDSQQFASYFKFGS